MHAKIWDALKNIIRHTGALKKLEGTLRYVTRSKNCQNSVIRQKDVLPQKGIVCASDPQLF